MNCAVTPRFTILLAVVRPPIFLPLAIESVLAQTVDDFELIVVCDGAPLETIESAHEHARRDPRIKVLVFPKGDRFGEAHWHEALTAALGQYVAHIEDDDLWFPTHLDELEKLLLTVDFGHVMHVWAKPDETIEMAPLDLAKAECRQRMLDEKFNRFGFSVCGYRLDAYRRLTEGWAPGQKGLWPDLNMWRKFLRREDFRFGTRMAVTALVLASFFRKHMLFEERAHESRKWLDRILDEGERAKIVEFAWRSVVGKELAMEFELNRSVIAQNELQAKLVLHQELHARLDAVQQDLQAKLEAVQQTLQDKIEEARVQQELHARLEGVQQDLQAKLAGVQQTLQAKIEEARVQQELQARLEGVQQDLQVKMEEARRAEQQSVALSRKAQADLECILNSNSWRITKPLRMGATVVKSGIRSLWRQ